MLFTHQIPTSPEEVFPLAESLASGLDSHEQELGVKQNTAVAVRKDQKTAREAQEKFQTSRSARVKSINPEFREAGCAVGRFLVEARKSLTYHLGPRWNEKWSEAGLTNRTTAIPKSSTARESLIAAMAVYFAKHPEQELPGLGVTATRAKELHDRLVAARKALHSQDSGRAKLRQKRDAAVAQLRRRLRATIAELCLLLDPESQVWEAFGLTKPGKRTVKAKNEAKEETLQVVAKAA